MRIFDPLRYSVVSLQLRSEAFSEVGVEGGGGKAVMEQTNRDVVESYALPKLTLITALKPSDRRSSQHGLKWR